MLRIAGFVMVMTLLMSSAAAQGNLESGPRFSNWATACKVDPIDDSRSCYALNGDLTVRATKGGLWHIVVGTRHSPGSTVYLRLDKKPAMQTMAPGWSGRQADAILYDFRETKTVTLRYTLILLREIVTREISMEGVNEALDYLIAQTKQ